MLSRILFSLFLIVAFSGIANADYAVCRGWDGKEYIACDLNCGMDALVAISNGNHPSCIKGGYGDAGTCNRHWTGWVGTMDFVDLSGNAPCPRGCFRERKIRDQQRGVNITKVQKRELWQCGGTYIPPTAEELQAAREAEFQRNKEKAERERIAAGNELRREKSGKTRPH